MTWECDPAEAYEKYNRIYLRRRVLLEKWVVKKQRADMQLGFDKVKAFRV